MVSVNMVSVNMVSVNMVSVIRLSVMRLSVIRLSVMRLSVIMVSVVAPKKHLKTVELKFKKNCVGEIIKNLVPTDEQAPYSQHFIFFVTCKQAK